ncbi:thiol-disulfide oxidoreductase DCC family protein [Haloarchaeobius sp. HME9146]|uniref:thiol-disulfide oxidoreductase DCC family protein n=1 Tax=Haloarchaeobius sp. HME9146 TaxID=2978732 RepID=UPI0021BDF570|nr:thiol-disulfide oxidoreductase DCC family protein [Haloarchaeobius sp. HME9146]MCT9098410.1 thiol-disulfide oxidoreductase DCC family protein [Haloarchaeobius sp. HME9146]
MPDESATPDESREQATTELEDIDGPVLLFDGVCNLCNGVVQFIIPRDPDGTVQFAPLQSDAGARLQERAGLPPDQLETVVLVEGDEYYTKSAAVIRVAEHLGGVYRVAAVGKLVPRFVRDRLYDFVADHRYGWFGKKDQCMVPSADVKERFLD